MSQLIDSFGRVHRYLRISLTSKCNFKCTYCYSESEASSTINTPFMQRILRIFAQLGINKVRLTGGEPLLHPEIVNLAKLIKQIPQINSLGITTNGLLLRRYMQGLKEAGLDSINISLDSLVPPKFAFITKINGYEKVWEGINLSIQHIPKVKLNCVVMKGVNDDEILDFVELVRERNIGVRFIEFMPFTGNSWEDSRFLPKERMIDLISRKYAISRIKPDDPIAEYYEIGGFKGYIGFIASMTTPFCERCDRVRITSDGKFKVCLHSPREYQLDPSMTDEELIHCIREELMQKPESHGGVENILGNGNRPMIGIGG